MPRLATRSRSIPQPSADVFFAATGVEGSMFRPPPRRIPPRTLEAKRRTGGVLLRDSCRFVLTLLLPRSVRCCYQFGILQQIFKGVLDGGTQPRDTLQIFPLAHAQPPNPRSNTSHSVFRGHLSLTHCVGFFMVIQWGIHSQKIIIGTEI